MGIRMHVSFNLEENCMIKDSLQGKDTCQVLQLYKKKRNENWSYNIMNRHQVDLVSCPYFPSQVSFSVAISVLF